MGKARILSAQGDGLYGIEILEDRTRAESRKALAEQRITQIDSELTDMEQDLNAAQQAVDDGAAAQDQAIADYQAEPTDEHRQAMQDQAAKLIKLAEARDSVRLKIANLNLERLTLQTTISSVEALPSLRQQEAWCADYTEDLSGEVATAEVPGEIGQVIIQPGYDGEEVSGWPEGVQSGATWSPSQDGAIQPALAGTPASVFYNLAMMPGWQKWRPTFRIATISNINNDLCDITLDAATSSQQGLNVNAASAYDDVPIYYMDCNGDAFEVGDRVLVAFSGQTGSPMVVGFEKEPRECEALLQWSTYNYLDNSTIYAEYLRILFFGFEVKQEIKVAQLSYFGRSSSAQLVYLGLYSANASGVPTAKIHVGKAFGEADTFYGTRSFGASDIPGGMTLSPGRYGILVAGAYMTSSASIQRHMAFPGFNPASFTLDNGEYVEPLGTMALQTSDVAAHYDTTAACSTAFNDGYPATPTLFDAVIEHPGWGATSRTPGVGMNYGPGVVDWSGYPVCPT